MIRTYQLTWNINPKPVPLVNYPSTDYLCVHIRFLNTTIKWVHGGGSGYSLKYSFDKVNWNDYTMNTDLTVNSYVYFKGTNAGRCQLKCSKPVFISGQIKSILVEDLSDPLPIDAACLLTFQGFSSRIIEAKYLILDPAIEYAGLFYGDTLLASGPEFTSTVDSKRFSRIYEDCIGLKEAPKTILNNGNISYEALFAGCIQLNDISQVKMNITNANYSYMFMEMFKGCVSLTTPLDVSSITTVSQPGVFTGMYMGCQLLARLPDLSNITTIADGAFNDMFEGCSGIRIYNTQKESTIPFRLNFSWEYNSAENANPTTKMFYGTTGDLRNLTEIPYTSIVGTTYYWDKTFYLKTN